MEGGHFLASICASPALVLTPHGFLNGHKATCYPGLQDKLTCDKSDAAKKVVVSGKISNKLKLLLIVIIVTSQGPGTSIEFSLELIN